MKREFDWEAMARRIETGPLPKPLAEMLRELYEMGVRDGAAEDDSIERIGAEARRASPT